jgi:hypothetical protein
LIPALMTIRSNGVDPFSEVTIRRRC